MFSVVLKSMTGYGCGEYSDEAHRIQVEIRSVNHRYGDVSVRMPRKLFCLEDEVRKAVSAALKRGKIEVTVVFEEFARAQKKIRVDRDLAVAYYRALQEIGEALDICASGQVAEIARYPEVLSAEEAPTNADEIREKLLAAVRAAVEKQLAMRRAEGENILADLSARVNNLEIYVDAIEQRAPQIVEAYEARLRARLAELLEAAQIDETRLVQEAALFADRINFTEEIVRLRSHFAQFRAVLDAGEAVGRKLDFIVQEMNREANTIASKANDAAVTNAVVDMKSEIEKIREQVQNIE